MVNAVHGNADYQIFNNSLKFIDSGQMMKEEKIQMVGSFRRRVVSHASFNR